MSNAERRLMALGKRGEHQIFLTCKDVTDAKRRETEWKKSSQNRESPVVEEKWARHWERASSGSSKRGLKMPQVGAQQVHRPVGLAKLGLGHQSLFGQTWFSQSWPKPSGKRHAIARGKSQELEQGTGRCGR